MSGPGSGGITASVATAADMAEVAALRTRVFVIEQGVPPEIEQDAADATAVHVLSRDDSGRVVATGRLLVHGRTAGIAHITMRRSLPAAEGATQRGTSEERSRTDGDRPS